ncbi:two-component system response regulator RppA [Baaleninema simplex]|uniref:two-component system response regulator RppA n=1 Tax=Baaleninema simplex TaxID=2862350 RepID=UPI000346F36B|nr:two-component system response regulator RppA [Baaleninema simplex]
MRILLVEDEPDLGLSIKQALSQEAYIVDWVEDGTTAWDYLDDRITQYILAILDWNLPGLSGLELCRKLRQSGRSLPVIMLTVKDTDADKVAGLDAGADDYLVKPFSLSELLARLRALQRRSPQFSPRPLQVDSWVLDYRNYTIANTKQPEIFSVALTRKEFQLLEYFMRHPNLLISREQLMEQVWEREAEPGSNVVAAQMRLLRRKLEGHRLELPIETIYGLGYRFNV